MIIKQSKFVLRKKNVPTCYTFSICSLFSIFLLASSPAANAYDKIAENPSIEIHEDVYISNAVADGPLSRPMQANLVLFSVPNKALPAELFISSLYPQSIVPGTNQSYVTTLNFNGKDEKPVPVRFNKYDDNNGDSALSGAP